MTGPSSPCCLPVGLIGLWGQGTTRLKGTSSLNRPLATGCLHSTQPATPYTVYHIHRRTHLILRRGEDGENPSIKAIEEEVCAIEAAEVRVSHSKAICADVSAQRRRRRGVAAPLPEIVGVLREKARLAGGERQVREVCNTACTLRTAAVGVRAVVGDIAEAVVVGRVLALLVAGGAVKERCA